MPSARSNQPQRPKPLGSHQASWIWGRHLVQETLQARYWPILELWLADDLPEAEAATTIQMASVAEVPVQRTSRNSLVSRCRGEDHQGYAARMAEFPYHNPESILRNS